MRSALVLRRLARLSGWTAACLLTCVAAALIFAGCTRQTEAPARSRFVLVGIDGGEWRVVRKLWSQGKLPNLQRLAERGSTATLRTAYNASPVIWTTIATGVNRERHGITDFVVPTAQGDVPVSSSLRRVPAIWNMLSRVGRRVAVLGWWASWPAEEVNGVVVTDRALLDLDRRVSPPSYLPRFLAAVDTAKGEQDLFFWEEEPQRRDHALSLAARQLAGENFDLLLLYFRSVDVVSHYSWKAFERDVLAPTAPGDSKEQPEDRVSRVYQAVDAAIGKLVAAAGPQVNVLVVSDHGFHAVRDEEVNLLFNLDVLLERLGFLTRGATGVDLARTQVFTYATPDHQPAKLVRFALRGRDPGGAVRPEDRPAIRRRLERALSTVRWESGAPVLFVREARPREVRRGGDFVVVVSRQGVTPSVRVGGRPLAGAVRAVGATITGTHTTTSHGIFLAAGPDIAGAAPLQGIRVHDITPTLLYGLGLPVAEDFDGRARTDLFTPEFQRRHPLRTIRSWGTREAGSAETSPADSHLLEELRALGYIK